MQPTPVFYPRGYFPPVSNTERQREFRRRNPDYYRRLQAKRRAALRAYGATRAIVAAWAKPPLMLPAPVELLVIPGVNAIPQTLAAARELAPLPVMNTRD